MNNAKNHVCPTCGTLQAEGDGFCDGCGTQLIAARYCETCGALAAHAGTGCRECGAALVVVEQATGGTAGSRARSADTPDWLKEPDPAPPTPTTEEQRMRRMKGSTASAPDTPDWLKEPDLAPPTPKPTPDWLKGPNPAPPAPRPTQPPAPQGSLPSIRTSAALPTAAPTFNVQRAPAQRAVPMRPTPLAAPTLAGNALTLAAGMAGLLGVLVAAANPALAIILFVVMVGLGGKRLGHAAAQGVGAVIDWLWQDPVLRRRLLGE